MEERRPSIAEKAESYLGRVIWKDPSEASFGRTLWKDLKESFESVPFEGPFGKDMCPRCSIFIKAQV